MIAKSFRFTEETIKKLKYLSKVNSFTDIQLLTTLIDKYFGEIIKEKLESIINGTNLNPVGELIDLLENECITKEYFLYSLPISPKLRDIVNSKIYINKDI